MWVGCRPSLGWREKAGRGRGVTLVEVIIAAGLMLAIGAAMLAILSQYHAHYRASWGALEDRRLATAALDALEHGVRAGYRVRVLTSYADRTPAPVGFLLEVTVPVAVPAEDVVHLYYASGGSLRDEVPGHTDTLVRNVTALRFSGSGSSVGVDLTVFTPSPNAAAVPFRLVAGMGVRQ